MANNKTKSKNKKNNKYATAQKEKLSASDFFIGFGKWETFSFCVGLLIGVVAIAEHIAIVVVLYGLPPNGSVSIHVVVRVWGSSSVGGYWYAVAESI